MKYALLFPIALTLWTFVVAPASNAQKAEDDTTRSMIGGRIDTMVDEILDDVDRQVMEYIAEREPPPIAGSMSLANYEKRYIKDHAAVARFAGDLVIEEEEMIDGSVVVSSGDVRLFGRIGGELLVVDGDVYILGEGWVGGEVIVISGKIHRKERSAIVGEERLLSRKGYERMRSTSIRYHPRRRYTLNRLSQPANVNHLLLRYNRVEGFFLGLGSPKRYYWDGRRRYSLSGSVGWGFKTHHWRYHLGFDRWFGNEHRLELGIEGHSFTDTKDEWRIGQGENTATAFFVREDYRDYFGREGFGLHVAQYFTSALRLRADYLVDTYKSLSRNTGWALFGGDTRFRTNPSIEEGLMRSVVVGFDLTTRDENRHRLEGWRAHASAEFAGGVLGGEFDFDLYLLDVRRYQPISRLDIVNFRVRVGSGSGSFPVQKILEIGGFGTMPAYRFKEFSGNRMILANVEYLLSGRVLDELSFWPNWLLSNLHLILFADAGWTGTAQPHEGFTGGFDVFALRDVKTDLGFGFGTRDGVLRLAFAWRTDTGEPVRISFRLSRPF